MADTDVRRRAKGLQDGHTDNSVVCLERGRRCVLLLANDVRFVLGETGVP